MKLTASIVSCLILTAAALCWAQSVPMPVKTAIQISGSEYRLLRDCSPFTINGVYATGRFEILRSSGGNCVLIQDVSRAEVLLEEAEKAGITAAIAIQLRQGAEMSYTNASSVAVAIQDIRPLIQELRNQPSLLLWIIQSDIADTEQTNIVAYRAVHALARMIRHEDPDHPVVADLGVLDAQSPKPRMLAMYCPEADVLGWSPAADYTNAVSHIRSSGWYKPYVLMYRTAQPPDPEELTPWLSPIEPRPSAKATWFLEIYSNLVTASQGLCLGSFAYSWDDVQMITPTWFGLTLPDGSRTEVADAMTYAWTRAYPANRAPEILSATSAVNCRLAPAASVQTAVVTASDPDSDPLTYEWVLLRELDTGDHAHLVPAKYEIVAGAVQQPDQAQTGFTVPRDGGPYRLMVHVRDDKGGATSANIPFLVEASREPIAPKAAEPDPDAEEEDGEPEDKPEAAGPASKVDIRYALGGGWTLYVNDTPFFIKGAGGQKNLDGIKAAGGNAIRTWSTDMAGKVLDEAHAHGLMVCLGLWMGQERHRFDYNNRTAVERQLRKLRAAVRTYRNHPALLMWCVGNEVEWGPGTNVAVYKAINEIARMVREEDPHHPTTTAFADIGKNSVKAALAAQYCPDLDILGINSYGGLSSMAGRLRDVGWVRPYMIMEFGPKGQWEVDKTEWGAEIEQMPLEKASFYLESYLKSVSASENWCLGSFVFSWDYKFECTPTWYSMHLLDGSKLNTVDTMWSAWSKKPPPNRSPQITKIESPLKHVKVKPAQNIQLSVTAIDPDGDPLRYEWILMSEHKSTDRDGVVHTELKPVPGRIKDPAAAVTQIQTPQGRGAYRVFCYVYDGQGGASSANMPFFVNGR